MKHNKLVRDNIPEVIRSNGEEPIILILDQKTYIEELKNKLKEEVNEFLESKEDPEELADILEVVYALAGNNGVSQEELERIRTEKRLKRGGFEKRIYLLETR